MAPEAGLGGAALLAAGGSLERVRVCAHDMCVHTCAYVRMAAHLRVYIVHACMCACVCMHT